MCASRAIDISASSIAAPRTPRSDGRTSLAGIGQRLLISIQHVGWDFEIIKDQLGLRNSRASPAPRSSSGKGTIDHVYSGGRGWRSTGNCNAACNTGRGCWLPFSPDAAAPPVITSVCRSASGHRTRAALAANGHSLVVAIYAHIGRNVSEPDKRFAGNNLVRAKRHLKASLKKLAGLNWANGRRLALSQNLSTVFLLNYGEQRASCFHFICS